MQKSGQDIVCAAVSVLIINTVNSLEAFTEDEVSGERRMMDMYPLLFEQSPITPRG